MIRSKLQFLGPASVLAVVVMAEGAVFALAHIPTSETLWYLNLRIFGVFQRGYYFIDFIDFPYSQLFLIALPLFAVATYGITCRRAFAQALASHLSFIYAGYLVFCGLSYYTKPLAAASLSTIAVSSGPNIYLPLALVGASFTSFLVSHFQYLPLLFRRKSMQRDDYLRDC
jgi:hypothetical protein